VTEVWLVAFGVVVVIHAGFLAYVLLGGFVAWRWPRSLVGHLAVLGWSLAGLLVPVACPLTGLENELRRLAGRPVLRTGFIDQYVEGVLYPARFTPLVRGLVVAVIVVSWVGLYQRWPTRRPEPGFAGVVQGRNGADI
jgi:hypothetical protein